MRNDIEDDTDTYYKAQILANTTAHQNYNIDLEEVEAVAEEYGFELEDLGVEIEEKNINYSEDSFNEDELIDDSRNKPAIMKITFENAEQLQKAESDITELIDRKYKGAYISVSCGEL